MARRIPTKQQQRALLNLWRRYHPEFQSLLRFRRNAYWNGPALVALWACKSVAINPDGSNGDSQ